MLLHRPLLLLTLVLACASARAAENEDPNTLTDAEKKDGWKLLFDGKTTTGWRGYKMKDMPPGWSVDSGALVRTKGGAGGKGAGGGDDIVTIDEYESFDFKIEWKIVAKGNSGILYHVSEEPVTAWHYAPEMQVLDNGPWQKRSKLELAGACYDMYAPAKDVTKPLGEWNAARLVVNGPKVEHWLNGEKMCEYELWSKDWQERKAKSKFKGFEKYGTLKKGFICLQDHSDRIEFRNIKIKVLKGEEKKTDN